MSSRSVRTLTIATLAIVLSALSTTDPIHADVPHRSAALTERLSAVRSGRAIVSGDRLTRVTAVADVFEARGDMTLWMLPDDAIEIRKAIDGIAADGLTPSDYHPRAIDRALQEWTSSRSDASQADLQVLLTDAVAALLDDVRYGRVQPSSIDPSWKVDPRQTAPPLDVLVMHVVDARSPSAAIESYKPSHFIYAGLKRALAQMSAAAAAGGWPTVPAGATVKPGMTDPRVLAIRRRLAATGELAPTVAATAVYDDQLKAAVVKFQEANRLAADGTIGAETIRVMNVAAADRVAQLRVNLERARWVVDGLQDSFVLVNLPAFKVYVIRGGKRIWETKAQVGKEARRTPSFRADMKYLVFNPDWTVPPTVLAKDVLPGMRQGGNSIKRKRLTIVDGQGRVVDPESIDWKTVSGDRFPYHLKQAPGADNALGRVKFIFPNEYSVFLHDTPHREYFASARRTFSSGCIRVENPLDLAAVLLEGQDQWTRERIDKVVGAGKSQTVFLKTPLPVLIVYWTASVGANGGLHYAQDIYGLDAAVLRKLDGNAMVAD
jgi:L,D-transpeptidase YcbB